MYGTITINGRKRAGATIERPVGSVGYRQSSCFVPTGDIDKFIPARFRNQISAAQIHHTVLITIAGYTWAVVQASFWTSKSRCLSYATVEKHPAFKSYIPITCVGPRMLLAHHYDDISALVILPLPERPH
jgi:hypothetical protein